QGDRLILPQIDHEFHFSTIGLDDANQVMCSTWAMPVEREVAIAHNRQCAVYWRQDLPGCANIGLSWLYIAGNTEFLTNSNQVYIGQTVGSGKLAHGSIVTIRDLRERIIELHRVT